jgi:hypothetical protein
LVGSKIPREVFGNIHGPSSKSPFNTSLSDKENCTENFSKKRNSIGNIVAGLDLGNKNPYNYKPKRPK